MLPLRVVLRQHVEAVLRVCKGNGTQAARQLGIDRKTLYRMLQRWAAEEQP
jgi:transcriptional regulator of acetoin/glycerol metabolism